MSYLSHLILLINIFLICYCSEVSLEFSKRTREVALEIMKGISESLGLESDYIYKTMDLERGLQLIAANYYPPCPQPELAIGIPHHTDHGLVTLLIENDINGLQVEHNGKWVSVNTIPNAFLVNLADHMQVTTIYFLNLIPKICD